MAADEFPFEFDRRFVLPLSLWGIRPGNSIVRLDDDRERLDVRFGPFRLVTPYANLRDVQITRDYRWFRTIGPRLSLKDRGATFGTNTAAGVCVCFNEPVGALFGKERLPHPGLTMTVADPEGFADAVRARQSADRS